ncbi:MAG: phosphoribosylglycinamide formyltransferase [Mucilaginibacter polytrichastri]|nr:phosphoribosylglycinamide formyltransferase [Mucilaginibacter polytrichastri]
MKKRIAIFASGSGSNAQKIMEYFKRSSDAEVCIVLSNNPEAYVLQRADNFEIPTHIFDRVEFYETDQVLDVLRKLQVDLIVLAGFLWLVPDNLIKAYRSKIINIHPSLLPKYGGKGMYGDRVHKTVLANKDSESGVTIHFVSDEYDTGEVIHQSRFRIEPGDDLEMIKFKGQQLEHHHFPRVIENLLKKMK